MKIILSLLSVRSIYNVYCIVEFPTTPDSQHGLRTSNDFIKEDTEYLQMARKGGGHSGI